MIGRSYSRLNEIASFSVQELALLLQADMNGMRTSNGTSAQVAAPIVIDVPVKGSDEVVTIDCSDLPDDPRVLCQILSGEEADSKYWIKLAVEYRHNGLLDQSIAIIQEGLVSPSIQRQPTQNFSLHSLLASLYVAKSRSATTGIQSLDGAKNENKEHWQQLALQSLNYASSYKSESAANSTMKGVLSILKAEKDRPLDEANKHFDAALKEDAGNLFAMLGKGRVLYARKNYRVALAYFQKVLQARPTLVPDPRIGIGLCFWQMSLKDDALAAWSRALEVDPENSSATLLLGLYWISNAFENVSDENMFQKLYARGLKLVTQSYKSFPIPLAGIAIASYMFSTRKLDAMQRTLEKVLAFADLPSLKADAFFWIARGQHFSEAYDKANSFYALARTTEPESLTAAMAIGQLQLTREDVTDAKLTFESVLEKQPKCIEALSVLGSIYAQEALDPNFKGDKITHRIKAKACLDKAIHLTNESKQRTQIDTTLHFTRAMLSEGDTSLQALKILEQAADIQSENGLPVSPQVLNNMAVIHHQDGSFDVAREIYQKAIEECIKLTEDKSGDTDTLLATITYNLGRCEEQSENLVSAKEIFTGLINRYPDFSDAAARLVFMQLQVENNEEVISSAREVMENDPTNVEVRALYGWLLNRQKKNKTLHFNDDPERKHFNHTLKYVDNYERYSLVALGNFYIKLARETRADSDANKLERHKHYDMAIKFFERALHYDNKNAYAAQGLAIAFAEHKQYQKAINIFGKVRETIRDESIFLNMGHCLCELHQYSRAIENYETALKTFHNGHNLDLHQCLGRAWLSRGREERSPDHLREALRYTKLARTEAPDNLAIAFNVAFIQFQFAEVLRNTAELNRTVVDLEEAAQGLEEAVKTFTALAEHKQPPYPKADIQQRATMGRNTTIRQLERAIVQQKEFESKNAEKVAQAKAKRDEERARREAALKDSREAEMAKQEALIQKRKEMQEEARKWAEHKRQEEDMREAKELEKAANKKSRSKNKKNRGDDSGSDDMIDDSQPGTKTPKSKTKKRTLRKSKKSKKSSSSDSEAEDEAVLSNASEVEDETSKPTKRRKTSKKYISAEIIESDEDQMYDEDAEGQPEIGAQAYANESMLNDRERDEDVQNEVNDNSAIPGAVPLEDSNAPATNESSATADSILLKDKKDSLQQGETPGIGVNGM